VLLREILKFLCYRKSKIWDREVSNLAGRPEVPAGRYPNVQDLRNINRKGKERAAPT